MRVIITGDDDFFDYYRFKIEVNNIIDGLGDKKRIEIVSGGDRGPDKLAERYAKEKKLRYKKFPINWQDFSKPCDIRTNKYGEYNALAGVKRNKAMRDYAGKNKGLIIIFWDGQNKYTRRLINDSNREELYVALINYKS